MTKPPRTTGGERIPLTKQAVWGGAVELADEIGVAPLTIRKLAAKLGVKPMAIYHHVASKDEIFDGMVEIVFGEIELPPRDLDWRAAIRIRSCSARDVLARHPWAAAMIDSRVLPGPVTLGHHDKVLGCLRGGGFSIVMTAHAVALIDSYIYGFALQETSLPLSDPDEVAEVTDALFESFPAADYPNIIELTAEHVMKPGYKFSHEFDFGLDLILDGLEAAAKSG